MSTLPEREQLNLILHAQFKGTKGLHDEHTLDNDDHVLRAPRKVNVELLNI